MSEDFLHKTQFDLAVINVVCKLRNVSVFLTVSNRRPCCSFSSKCAAEKLNKCMTRIQHNKMLQSEFPLAVEIDHQNG